MVTKRLFLHDGSLGSTGGNWVDIAGPLEVDVAAKNICLSAVADIAVEFRTVQCYQLPDDSYIDMVADEVLTAGVSMAAGDGIRSPAVLQFVRIQHKQASAASRAVVMLREEL